MLAAGTLEARISPLRSSIRPRFAGNSSVRSTRTAPWRWKNALPNTCTQAARRPSAKKHSAISATTKRLRQTGVRLASNGLCA